jgi:hypothetical protein
LILSLISQPFRSTEIMKKLKAYNTLTVILAALTFLQASRAAAVAPPVDAQVYEFGSAAIRLAGVPEKLTPILNKELNTESNSTEIQILEPSDGTFVKQPQNIIKGRVTTREAIGKEVWIVVNVEVNDNQRYYVQPSMNINSDREFQGKVYIGDENTPLNTRFEIRAFVTPKEPLSEGKLLYDWPKAKWSSKTISVHR